MKAILPKNAFFRFLITASVSYLLLFVFYQFAIKRFTLYDQRFIGTIINSADWVLNLLGYKTFKMLQDADLQVIGIDGSNGVWVGSNCNALKLFGLFAVFIICYPGRQLPKLWYVPLGLLCIHLLNITRVVVLATLAYNSPEWLQFNHTYTFTILIYGFIFALWMLWVNQFANKPNKPS